MTLSQYDNGAPNLPCKIDSRRVSHRYVSPDGSSEQTWTYSYSTTGYTTTVTDPAGNDSVHTFEPTGMHETQAQYYSGTGTSRTLLKTVANSWVSDSGAVQSTQQEVGTCGYINWRTTQSTTTLNDTNQAAQVQTDYNTFTYSSPYSSCGNTTSRLNPVETREYDWGPNGSPGPLLRRTDFTYLQDGNSNYLNLHIWDRPAAKYAYNGSGTQAAATTFEYDNYTAGIAASGAIQHDPAFNASAGYTLRGNLTASSLWRNTDGVWLISRNQYDDAGNILSTTDPVGNPTAFSYADNFTDGTNHNAQAFVTQVTYPATGGVNHIEKKQYFFNTALPAASCGLNFPPASACKNTYSPPQPDYATFTYDLMNRPLSITSGDGGSTTLSYHDPLPLSASSTVTIGPPGNLVNTMILDGLGRVNHTQLNSDPCGIDYTDVTYDVMGRKSTVSNPYRTSDSCNMGTSMNGTTTYQYDALSRPSKTIPTDGSSTSNNITDAYSGNCTTVTDQAGKGRKSCSDALGRVAQVFEDPAGLNYETDYTYDALDNLLTVNQKGGSSNSANWRTRTFTYDSLSRLLCASNPENSSAPCPAAATSSYTTGTTGYSYDSDANLLTKTSPAPNQTGTATVTISYCYDQLNRLTSEAYTNQSCPMSSPVTTYIYDQTSYNGLTIGNGIGRRTGMTDASGQTAWSLDLTSGTGWKTTERRTINGVTKTTVRQNNLAGALIQLTYPSGTMITYTYTAAVRPVSAVDTTHNINYATGASYTPAGALASLQNGSSIVSTYYYNTRLQPCRISVKSSGTAPGSCTDTANIGNILDFTYNFGLGTADNGNVASITSNPNTARSQSFTYDALNRIAIAQTTSTSGSYCWSLTFGYDPWGNLLSALPPATGYTGCTQNRLSVTVNSFNQLNVAGYVYDAAGNLTTVPAPGAANYTYNAENQLTSTAGVNYTYDGDGNRVQKSNGKLYWFGDGSNPLDETDASGNLTDEYIFFDGKRIARRDPNNNVDYYFADHVGTARIVTNASGTIQDDSDFYPFGGERSYLSSSGNTYKLTGKEHDNESGLDDFGARYYSSAGGRFITTDPVVVTPDRIHDPQQLNEYAYVRNNPLILVDPTGEVLRLSGDVPEAQADVCHIVGSDNCNRVVLDQQTGVVTFDTTGLDLSKNEGALLISQLVNSNKVYDYSVDTNANTAGGPVSLKNEVESNLDDRPDERYSKGKNPTDLPPKGVNDQVTINPHEHYVDSQGRAVPQWSVAFHELAEAYGKVNEGKSYGDYRDNFIIGGTTIQLGLEIHEGAHNEAVKREQKLRDQRPNLKDTGRAGDTLVRVPHK